MFVCNLCAFQKAACMQLVGLFLIMLTNRLTPPAASIFLNETNEAPSIFKLSSGVVDVMCFPCSPLCFSPDIMHTNCA